MSTNDSKARYELAGFFETYLRTSDEKSRVALEIAKALKDYPSQSILDIGTGDGSLIRKIVHHATSEGQTIERVVCLDQTSTAEVGFVENKKMYAVNWSFHQCDYAKYIKDLTPNSFDVSIASHSLYWDQNIDQTLSSMLRVACTSIVVMRDNGLLLKLERDLLEQVIESPRNYFSSSTITERLQVMGANFSLTKVPCILRIPSADSPDLINLIAFLCDVDISKVTSQLVASFLNIVNGDSVEVPYFVDVILIRRFDVD